MKTICQVCVHQCNLEEGKTGRCRARRNEDGVIVPINYGKITSMALDPIEKKPLYHFYPGTTILSVGSFGCNMNCPFCQNHEISMIGETEAATIFISPGELVTKAEELKEQRNIGVAFTYNEPLIDFEYVRDTSILLKEAGMKSVVVTNGCFHAATAKAVLPYVDALNIDLKGFTQEFYHKLGGNLEMVKEFIKQAAAVCHVEITTLIIPGENDDEEEMRKLSGWIASIDRKIPLHVSRFFPAYKMKHLDPTQVRRVYDLAEIAREQLLFVHEGNC